MVGGILGARQELAVTGVRNAVESQASVVGAIAQNLGQSQGLASPSQQAPAQEAPPPPPPADGPRGHTLDIFA